MAREMIVIGIGARARVGKDVLAKCLFSLFDLDGYDCKIYSLANALKLDVEPFLRNNLNYDVWSQDTEEKSKFRELLVWYGKQKRLVSKGQYWTDIVQKQIISDSNNIQKGNNSLPFVAIVTDIRYAEYEKDEAQWIQNNPNWNGKLIHLTRFNKGEEILPANIDEQVNDPKIKEIADIKFTWETLGDFPSNFFQSEHYNQIKTLYETLK